MENEAWCTLLGSFHVNVQRVSLLERGKYRSVRKIERVAFACRSEGKEWIMYRQKWKTGTPRASFLGRSSNKGWHTVVIPGQIWSNSRIWSDVCSTMRCPSFEINDIPTKYLLAQNETNYRRCFNLLSLFDLQIVVSELKLFWPRLLFSVKDEVTNHHLLYPPATLQGLLLKR